jgi:hypothetical protein
MAYFEIEAGWLPTEMAADWFTTRYNFIINLGN